MKKTIFKLKYKLLKMRKIKLMSQQIFKCKIYLNSFYN